jgi:hypothetical protein
MGDGHDGASDVGPIRNVDCASPCPFATTDRGAASGQVCAETASPVGQHRSKPRMGFRMGDEFLNSFGRKRRVTTTTMATSGRAARRPDG